TLRWLPAEDLTMAAAPRTELPTDDSAYPQILELPPSRTQATPTRGAQARGDGTLSEALGEDDESPEPADMIAMPRWVEAAGYRDARPDDGGLVLHHWMPPAAVPRDVPSSRLLVMA